MRIINSVFAFIIIIVVIKTFLPDEAGILANEILLMILNIIKNLLENIPSLP